MIRGIPHGGQYQNRFFGNLIFHNLSHMPDPFRIGHGTAPEFHDNHGYFPLLNGTIAKRGLTIQ
jgi:hypothetical protein